MTAQPAVDLVNEVDLLADSSSHIRQPIGLKMHSVACSYRAW